MVLGFGSSAEVPPRHVFRVEASAEAAARATNPLSSVFPPLAVTRAAAVAPTGRGKVLAQVEVACGVCLVLLLQKSGAGVHGGPHAQVTGHGHHFGQVLATHTQGGGIGELQQGQEALFTETCREKVT